MRIFSHEKFIIVYWKKITQDCIHCSLFKGTLLCSYTRNGEEASVELTTERFSVGSHKKALQLFRGELGRHFLNDKATSQISDEPLFSRQQASPAAKMERMWVLKINTSVILVVLLFSAIWGVFVMELLSIESSKLCGLTNQQRQRFFFFFLSLFFVRWFSWWSHLFFIQMPITKEHL